jgi:Kef-type K+ transport system membrane component KefB
MLELFSFSTEPWFLGHPLIAAGLLVIFALLGGEAVWRGLRLPRIVGYAATGMALGAVGVVPAPLGGALRSVVDLCLGVVLFELGTRIDLGWLRRAPWLAALAVAESAVVGVCLYAAFHLGFGLAPWLAACGAVIGISTSPAVVLRVARDLGAEGQVTERMLMLSLTNSAAAVLALAGLAAAMPDGNAGDPLTAVARALALLLGSLACSAALALGGVTLFRVLGKQREGQLIGALGLVLLSTGVTAALQLPSALVLLALGAGLRSLDRKNHVMPLDFGRAGQVFYLLLFALVGASLDLPAAFGVGAVAGLLFVAVRAAAKSAAVLAFAHVTRQPVRKAALLALTLQPMSGLAVVLAYDAARAQPELSALVVPAVLAAVVAFDLAGPICVQLGLRWAGEARPSPA